MARSRKRRQLTSPARRRFRPGPALVSFESLEPRIQLSAVTVENSLDVVNGNTASIAALIASDGGDGISLREAILAANNTSGADTIDFDASLAGSTIVLSGTQMTISDALTITGLGASQLTIEANELSRHFVVDDGTAGEIAVQLSGLTLTGGSAPGVDGSGNGASIFNLENLTVTNSTISGNAANFKGGGIYNIAGALSVANSTISGNIASYGAGIFNHSTGTVTVANSAISGNTASYFGGGLYIAGGTATVSHSTITGNTAEDFGGGGIANYTGTLNVIDTTIAGNSAQNNGGGIYNSDGTVNVTNSTVSGNSVAFFGGGLYNSTGSLTVTNSTISGNSSSGGDGGGIRNFFGTLSVANSTISGNSAAFNGGGIFNYSGSTATVASTIISGNTGSGGAEISNAGTFNANANNLFGRSSNTNAQAFVGVTAGASDITATSDGTDPTALASILNPTLAANGGTTLTHALAVGSPAINAGNNAILPADVFDLDGDLNVVEALSVDQRGVLFVRAFGTVDVGAYEAQSTIIVNGTSNDDEITVSLGATFTVTVNGVEYSLGSGIVSRIEVHGLAGNDTLHVMGTTGVDNVTMNPGSMELVGPGITVTGDSFESIDVASGGGQDRAILNDSVGDDQYTATPLTATLQGTGYINRVDGFRRVYAYSYAGGFDTAAFDDSAGNDNFIGEEARSWLTGTNFYNSASRFDQVDANASSGYDLAMLWDSAGDDVFHVDTSLGSLSGAGFDNRGHNFDRVYAYSYVGGTDEAHFYDSSGDDRFIGKDVRSTIQNADITYYGSATRFEEVYAHADNGGNDRADLNGNANSDTFVSGVNSSTMSSSDYFYQVASFENVNATAGSGGSDTATIQDSAGDDYFLNIPTSSYVVWGSGRRASLFGFADVDFNASAGGNDVAEFQSLGTLDEVFGLDALISIERTNGRTAQATGMDEAIAQSLAAPGPITDMTSLDYVFTQTGVWS
ncbi:MAG: right-handed parallel beta-helix repeat-containing protein [Planctomycetaceae bacterium]